MLWGPLMSELLTLLKKMLIEGEFDTKQKGVSPLLDKKEIIDILDTWQEFIHTRRRVGEYWSSGEGYRMYQYLISMAEELGYDAGVDDADRDGIYVSADYEGFDDVVNEAEEFMNTYFREEGFFWGVDDVHGGYGYYPMEDRYTLTFVAYPGENPLPLNAWDIVTNEVRKMPCMVEVSPVGLYVMEVEVETAYMADVRQQIADILTVTGFGRVVFATE